MDDQLLRDPEVEPTNEVLKREFGDWYPVYKEFVTAISSEPQSLKPEWKYYKDGKAWLCKISRKRKTVVWLSAWKDHFKLGFYFTDKTGAGINDLAVSPIYKENYESSEPIGKLKPLIAEVSKVSQLEDIYSLIEYKVGKL